MGILPVPYIFGQVGCPPHLYQIRMISYCKSAATRTEWKEAISGVARDYFLSYRSCGRLFSQILILTKSGLNAPVLSKPRKPGRDLPCKVFIGWDITGISIPDLVSSLDSAMFA